jgi:hypothetical protein
VNTISDLAHHELGLAVAGENAANQGMGREVLEGVDAVPEVAVVEVRAREVGHMFARARVNLDQALGVLDRHLLEQNRVHDAEDRGVETDAEGEGKTATRVNPGL